MQRVILVVMMALLGGLFSCQSAHRIKPEVLKHTHIPHELSLTSADGNRISLVEIVGEHNGAVVIFWQSSCPCVKRYEERINQLFDRYSQDGLAMMYVSSNSDESFKKALQEFETRKSPLPLMRDHNGQLARLLDVKGTPSVGLFNQAGDLIYLGWIDNEHNLDEKGRIAYLEDAIKEHLAGKEVSVKTSPMFGCSIR